MDAGTHAEQSLSWREQLQALDAAVYAAIAATPTPTFDRALGPLSAHGGPLEAVDGRRRRARGGRRAARAPGRRRRPGVARGHVHDRQRRPQAARPAKPARPRGRRRPITRHVSMPRSTSFPSGHAASAFAFSRGWRRRCLPRGVPLLAVATLVAYSRVHVGVHYPADVVAGAVLGGAVAPAVAAVLRARGRR
jgi:undecaprenyl-diphosphatase